MTKIVRLQEMEDTYGTALPREMLDRMGLGDGDRLIVEEKDGGLFLKPVDPDLQEAMEIYERGARKYRNALRELAK